jgi:dolichyl-phosphate-mannose-protein mannosyltransferase
VDRPGVAGERRYWLGLGAIVAGASALIAVGTTRVHEWVVQTDEMLYAKLARHIGHSGSLLPTLHGHRVGFVGVVYPILLSPFYATLDGVESFRAAHVVNAVLFASTAVPTYLLGRRVVTRNCALVVALLAVTVPWAVNAAFVMSEPAAYPVFVWAVLACHVAITDPSDRADVLAAVALALAYLTRPQFLFLVAVLPVAALVTRGPRRALREHHVLAGVYALGILVVLVLAAIGDADRLLGDYGVTATQGSLLPAIAWKSAALHIDVLAVGLGILPLLLGGGWAYSSLSHESVRLRAFAALTALAVPALALETASYDVRFGGPDVIRDRYLFYLAPLLLLATAVCLFQEHLPLVGIAAMTVFFSATAVFADFTPVAGLWVDSPESVLNGLIHDQSGRLSPGVFVALCGVVLGAICFALVLVPRPAAALGVTLVVFCFGGAVAGYAFHRLLNSNTPLGVPSTGKARDRDWVDRHLLAGGSVAALAYPISRDWGQSAIQWWDAEFWNNRVQAAFVARNGRWTYTPFPSMTLRLNFETGRFKQTDDAPPYVLAAPNDSRFGLVGSQEAENGGLVVWAVDRPYRARWASRGLDIDGWTRPGRAATIRVFALPGEARRRVEVTALLDAPPEAGDTVSYGLGEARGTVAPGKRAAATARVCIPAGGHADLTLEAGKSATIAGPPIGPEAEPPRDVGVALSGVQVAEGGGSC